MKIRSLKAWHEVVELKEPFSISFSTEEAVNLHFVEISTSNGLKGYGSAKPFFHVTLENSDSCADFLQYKAWGTLEMRIYTFYQTW